MSSEREGGEPLSTPRSSTKRRPISCLPCRQRKLKCDRIIPACSSCMKRGDITECSYAPRKSAGRVETAERQEGAPEVQSGDARLERLERLVLSLAKTNGIDDQSLLLSSDLSATRNRGADNDRMQQTESNKRSATTDGPRAKKPSRGYNPQGSNEHCTSVDEAPWVTLLNEIGEVRAYLEVQNVRYEEQTKRVTHYSSDDPGPTLLFGTPRGASRAEILMQLPSRHCCDMVVRRLFANIYPALHILHAATFQKQYERFWENQETTPLVWIAQLFVMLRLAMLDYVRNGDEPPEFKGKCRDMASIFRKSFSDCLVLAGYMQPQEFLIESLCFHLYAEYVSTRDAKSTVWVLIGMIVRLALRMGYHHLSWPQLSPFKSEMRRRVWAFIRQADIMFSFQMGMPSMVRLRAFEQNLPRNIHDDYKFNENCVELPPALPDSEPTQVGYLLAKVKLAFGYAKAAKEITRTESIRWERVLEIDCELRRIYDAIPESFKIGPFASADSLTLLSYRFNLASLHHKSLCVIHSRFSELGRTDPRYSYSRKVCLTSAMTILRFQAIQNQQLPVDGRFRTLTGYQTSLTIHDYLIAATLISTDLYADMQNSKSQEKQTESGGPTRTEMLNALSASVMIFRENSEISVEAFKAGDVLEMLVKRFRSEWPGAAQEKNPTPCKGRKRQKTNLGQTSEIADINGDLESHTVGHGATPENDAAVPNSHVNAGNTIHGETPHATHNGDLTGTLADMLGNETAMALSALSSNPFRDTRPDEPYPPQIRSYDRFTEGSNTGTFSSSDSWPVSTDITEVTRPHASDLQASDSTLLNNDPGLTYDSTFWENTFVLDDPMITLQDLISSPSMQYYQDEPPS